MQITCASCKSVYTLTMDQIQRLPQAIFPCRNCARFIKITSCPFCKVYYSITFSSAQQNRYTLNCERCGKPFIIEFPLIRDGAPPAVDRAPVHEPGPERPPVRKPKPKHRPRVLFSFLRRARGGKRPPHKKEEPRREAPAPGMPADGTGVTFTLSNLFAVCATAFTPGKIIAAAVGIAVSFIAVMAYGWLVNLILAPEYLSVAEYARSLLNIIPFAIIFFIYLLSAAVISRMTMNFIAGTPGFNARSVLRFLGESFVPVFLVNIALFAAVDLILILFGHIPIIGPVLFALLFLPIYAASFCIMIVIAVGFWFYPPIIAESSGGSVSPLRGLVAFIRQQNFRLAYTIPLMTIITAVTFAAIYVLHFGSFTLSMYLSKVILAEEGERIFAAIPSSLLQISDLAIMGSEGGLFRSLTTNLLLTHSIGGLIIGIVFSLISIFLFSSFISISSTLSTHLYLMMKRGTDMDDASKVRLLVILVLILAGMFLVKKILF